MTGLLLGLLLAAVTPVQVPDLITPVATLSAACASGSACPANSTAAVALAGHNSISVNFTTSTSPVLTVVAECSHDGGLTYMVGPGSPSSGTVWLEDDNGSFAQSLTSPSAGRSYNMVGIEEGVTHCRARVSAYTSGSSTLTLSAALFAGSLPHLAAPGATSSSPPSVAMIGAQDSIASTTARALRADANGALYVRQGSPGSEWQLFASSSAVTATSTATAALPGVGLSYYVTDLTIGSSIISTAANFIQLQSCTTANCAGTCTPIWGGYAQAAFAQIVATFTKPLKAPANTCLCWMTPGAGSRQVYMSGFIAP
jgi:hypothetical protein